MGAVFPDPHYDLDYGFDKGYNVPSSGDEVTYDFKFELTLPSIEDIQGENCLSPLHTYGRDFSITDLVDFRGCRGRFCCVKMSGIGESILILDRGVDTYMVPAGSHNFAIRPVLHIEDFEDFNRITSSKKYTQPHHGTAIVEFGEYPQDAAPAKVQKELDMAERLNGLKKTGKVYTFEYLGPKIEDSGFEPDYYDEYEFRGKKYIKVTVYSANEDSVFLDRNKAYWYPGDMVWIEVQPVEWLIDEKKQTLISKKGLLSGIHYNLSNGCESFDKMLIKWYLDNYMAKDLFSNTTLKIEKSEPSEVVNPKLQRNDEINKIIDDILASVPEYRDRDKVKEKIKDAHVKYEDELSMIFKSKESDAIILTHAPRVSADEAYIKFKLALADIKSETTEVSKDEKEYVAMYDFMERAISAFNSDMVVKDNEAVINDISQVKHNVLPLFKKYNDVNIENELKAMLLNYKNEIVAFLKNGEDNEIAKIKTFKEFKLLFGSKFVVYLANVIKLVHGNTTLEKISNDCINKMQDNFLKTGIRYINKYLAEINEMMAVIMRDGTDEEKAKMQKILGQEYTLDNNVDEVTQLIRLRFMKLYKIILEIKKRQEIEKSRREYNVSVDLSKK